ncbi:hypothetical protein [Photobacterium sp. GB-72]|uniref:hypothetical protein n=1 Tax=Photobacterium sp. GB-72 TaxID=2022105 RepID=UPI000D157334|nr:hypothetical protein [Photobacterium sp. GB-72]PSV27618.1 hypothetical protein C9J40_19990 [Photobacterium sp. GB-72]
MLLDCSCCGKLFRGEQTASHDTGFGTCQNCEESNIEKANRLLDEAILKIQPNLKPNKLKTFNSWPIDKQRNFAMEMIQKGIISFY